MSKKNQPDAQMNPQESRDEALFDALGKSKKKKKRKILRTVLIIVLIVAAVLTAAVIILQQRVRDRFAVMDADVLSYDVKTGTISTVVSGSGILENVDTETVTVPTGVELTDILVSYGDTVEAGTLLATVDMGTVRSAMSALQTAMEELDDQISDAEGDAVSAYVKAGVAGRVKILHAQADTDVADAMVAQGALAVLSLDGYMAVDIQTEALSMGDSVTVVRADGSALSGMTEYTAGDKATILVTDNGPEYNESVTVLAEDGTQLGAGTLYIHAPLSVTGYAGTVSKVNISENQKVSASTTLFTLKNTETSANYDTLLRQRQEAEEDLLELLRIQRSGGMTAPVSGSICQLAELEDEAITDLAVISPDVSMSVTITVDESDILSLALDQAAEVTVSSVSEEILEGTVTEIDKTGTIGAYTAVITLNKVDGMLPGMTASVDVRIEGVDDAIIIPVDALHQTSAGAYVYTAYDEELQEYGGKVDVVTGLSNNDYVEIKSGLSVGDKVYYTEKQTFASFFANMAGGGRPGGSDDYGGGNAPNFEGGNPPEYAGEMPGGRG